MQDTSHSLRVATLAAFAALGETFPRRTAATKTGATTLRPSLMPITTPTIRIGRKISLTLEAFQS